MDDTKNVLLDAMPYVDRDYEIPELQARVDQMIADEMAKGGNRAATTLPDDVELFRNNPALAEEMKRIEAKQPLAALDFERYELPAPPIEKDDDLEAWEKAVNNAKAQMEAQQSRMLNLELLSKYGSNSWLIHNYQMEGMVKQLQQDLEDHRKKVLELNKVRKYDQISQGNMLQSLELRWSELIGKIISLESAILGLEAEVEDMEQQRDYLARNARTN